MICIRALTMLPVCGLFVATDWTAKKLDALFDYLDEKIR